MLGWEGDLDLIRMRGNLILRRRAHVDLSMLEENLGVLLVVVELQGCSKSTVMTRLSCRHHNARVSEVIYPP